MKARIAFAVVLALALGLGLAIGLSQPQPAQAQALGGIVVLPVLRGGGPAAANTQVVLQIQNVGNKPTRAAMFLFGGYSGYCEPQNPGPQKIECTGIIAPGSAWVWTGAMLPIWAQSGVIKAVIGCPAVSSYSDVPSSGVPLAIDVTRTMPGDTDPQVSATANYAGILGEAMGTFDPVFGGFTYYAPAVRVNSQGYSSVIYIQNAGTDCTSVDLWLKAQDDCLRSQICSIPVLAPGEVYPFDPASCVGGPFDGSIWIRTTQPAGVLIDTFGYDTRASYSGVSGPLSIASQDTAGALVNYGPLIFREFQGWETRVDVQNLSGVYSAAVKVYFLDQSGDIITTLVDWVCPRGSQTFYLPVINTLPGQWVGAIRVESQAGLFRPDPPNITSVVTLTKYEGPARAQALEAIAYNALTELQTLDWSAGPGYGAVLALPSLLKNQMGLSTEIAINNVNPNPGYTDFAIYLFDQNGLLDYVCEKLNEKQVEYIKLQDWGYINPGFLGSAVISATHTTQYGGYALAGVVVERSTPLLSGDTPGDESNGSAISSVAGTFDVQRFLPSVPVCPGQAVPCTAAVAGTVYSQFEHGTPPVTQVAGAGVLVRIQQLGQDPSGNYTVAGGIAWTGATDSSGHFLASLPPGHYRVLLGANSLPAIAVEVLGGNVGASGDLIIEDCSQQLVWSVRPAGLHIISGFAAESCWTVAPHIGRLSGATVELWLDGSLIASTNTNSEGYFAFQGVVENQNVPYHVKICFKDNANNMVCFETDNFLLDSTDVNLWFKYNSIIPDLSSWCPGGIAAQVVCEGQAVTEPLKVGLAPIGTTTAVSTKTTVDGAAFFLAPQPDTYKVFVDVDNDGELDEDEPSKVVVYVTRLELKTVQLEYCPPDN